MGNFHYLNEQKTLCMTSSDLYIFFACTYLYACLYDIYLYTDMYHTSILDCFNLPFCDQVDFLLAQL